MKRHGHLWEQVISFEALLRAADKARKGKRFRPAVALFHFDQERALWQLHEELSTKTYRPGDYRSFFIYQPKKRQISAAPYRDRVVHHALVNVLEPIYEGVFIGDSYACRKGKGTHAAVARCQQLAQRFRYVLKADIQKFFPTVDHKILKQRLARKIKDPDVLWLIGQIIDHSNPQEEIVSYFPGDDLFTPGERRRGIPIGNQTGPPYRAYPIIWPAFTKSVGEPLLLAEYHGSGTSFGGSCWGWKTTFRTMRVMGKIPERSHFMIELTQEQAEALDVPPQPAVAVDPRTGQKYRLIREEVYQVMCGIARPFNRNWDNPADDDLIRKTT